MIGLRKDGFELALPFVIRQRTILEQRLTGNAVEDGDRAIRFDSFECQSCEVIAYKCLR